MKDSKNQIIRSIKSYEIGGTSNDPCMETDTGTDWPGRKKKRKKSCREKGERWLKMKDRQDKVVSGLKTIGGVGATLGGLYLGGKRLYKKNPQFKQAWDEFKTDLGFKKGGIVRFNKIKKTTK